MCDDWKAFSFYCQHFVSNCDFMEKTHYSLLLLICQQQININTQKSFIFGSPWLNLPENLRAKNTFFGNLYWNKIINRDIATNFSNNFIWCAHGTCGNFRISFQLQKDHTLADACPRFLSVCKCIFVNIRMKLVRVDDTNIEFLLANLFPRTEVDCIRKPRRIFMKIH